MKLQGVFMIMPFLAVIASGNTIPNTDSYNVQRLEKRGDNDPDIKEFTDEDLMAKLMAKYKAQRKAQSDVFTEYSAIVKKLEILDRQRAQARAILRSGVTKDKTNEQIELLDSLKKTRRNRRIHDDEDDEDDESDELPNFLKVSQEFQGLLVQEGENNPMKPPNFLPEGYILQDFFEDKTNGPEESTSSSEDPYGLKHTVAEYGKEGPVESLGFLEEAYKLQRSLANDKLKEIDKLNQELLKIQDEVTFRVELNQELSKKQNGITFREALNKKLFRKKDENASREAFNKNILTKQNEKASREAFSKNLLKKQDETTSKDASNKKLPEKQAQAAVQSSGTPRLLSKISLDMGCLVQQTEADSGDLPRFEYSAFSTRSTSLGPTNPFLLVDSM
ncbi:hypothetical protein BASA50_003413 [Batrachochytrium salamandrivorans]|uniref:Uncharacterized protein n=1 Tax=Batrachochytrium salamandrivorans TaxID=1357716 RepID=A0ABQ8FIP1_9FUNG|nr:hypothetical protein BASA50_003413 [Batrachochytrium salamandrivorans]